MAGSFGAEMTMGFDHDKIHQVVQLGTVQTLHPYSAFFDENRKRDTGLQTFLKSNDIKEIHLAGLPLEEAVFNTALDGKELGHAVKILNAAVISKEEAQAKSTLIELEKRKIEII